jgi:murein L,D-transpeptidase YcbB/YkuD
MRGKWRNRIRLTGLHLQHEFQDVFFLAKIIFPKCRDRSAKPRFKKLNVFLLLLVSGAVILHPFQAAQATLEDRVSLMIRERAGALENVVFCSGELLCGSSILPRFYGQRGFRSAWFQGNRLNEQASALIKAVQAAEEEGLKPENYHAGRIEALAAELDRLNSRTMAVPAGLGTDIEMLLTDAFLLYGSNLLSGLVNPETIEAEWFIKSREQDFAALLQEALAGDTIWESLEELHPRHEGYTRLENARDLYSRAAASGPWPLVSAGETMKPGLRGPRVEALFRRLLATNDISDADKPEKDHYDSALEEAVKRFQARHGLAVDGKVGNNTTAALNVSLEERIRQINVNMERWRWLPHTFGEYYLLVNIANYELDIFEKAVRTLNMRVVVGKHNRKTPVFTEKMTYLELNPYWNVPKIIAVEDKLPKILIDPQYLKKQGFRVFGSWAEDAEELDPEFIDWTALGKDNFPYRLRQEPGALNALGRIKFMFPNRFAVYLHDTPDKTLFSLSFRGFSSGCIRVEGPLDLAAYLLRDDPQWTMEKLTEKIESRERTIIRLPVPVPVYLIYLTAWVDDWGYIHFRDDIYDRDAPLYKALMETPPGQKSARRQSSGGII